MASAARHFDLPPVLLRAFSERGHAESFCSGRIRFLERRCYRLMEDRERGDRTEGAAEWIVPGVNDVPVTTGTEYMNPVYVLCMSQPDVDLDHLMKKGPHVIRVLDSQRLFERLANTLDRQCLPDGRVCIAIDSGSVSYDKGELATALPDAEERTRMTFLQKPARFRPDLECRIGVVVSGPIPTATHALWVEVDPAGLFAWHHG